MISTLVLVLLLAGVLAALLTDSGPAPQTHGSAIVETSNPQATAVMESLSRSPETARAFLDPGAGNQDLIVPAEPRDVARPPLLGALLTRLSVWQSTLSHANPHLDGYPGYESLGDAILAATSDPFDPASERIADLAFRIYGMPEGYQIYAMRPQMAQLVTRELAAGNVGLPDSGSAIRTAALIKAFGSGANFQLDQLEEMANTFMDELVRQLSAEAPHDFLGAPATVNEVAQNGTTVGHIVGWLYYRIYIFQFNPSGHPEPPAPQYLQYVRTAENRLHNALTGNPTLSAAWPAFGAQLKASMEPAMPPILDAWV